jgi:hypothetical protein
MEVAEAIIMVEDITVENIVAESIRAVIRMEKELGNLKNQVMMNKKTQHLSGEVTDLIREVQDGEIVKVLLTLRKGRLVLIAIIMLTILRYFLFFVLS